MCTANCQTKKVTNFDILTSFSTPAGLLLRVKTMPAIETGFSTSHLLKYPSLKKFHLLKYPTFKISTFWNINLLQYPPFEISTSWNIHRDRKITGFWLRWPKNHFSCWKHWSVRLQLTARGENVLFWPQNLDIWGQKSIFCIVIAIFVNEANNHYNYTTTFPLGPPQKKFRCRARGHFLGLTPVFGPFWLVSRQRYSYP